MVGNMECIKYLPKNLKQLKLNLSGMNLGRFSENIRNLECGIKQLSNSLEFLVLDLSYY